MITTGPADYFVDQYGRLRFASGRLVPIITEAPPLPEQIERSTVRDLSSMPFCRVCTTAHVTYSNQERCRLCSRAYRRDVRQYGITRARELESARRGVSA